ncbi:MAG: HD-GYP domain-containing protein [Dissulfurispiraceae bacterium]
MKTFEISEAIRPQDIISQLAVLLRISITHDISNDALLKSVHNFICIVDALLIKDNYLTVELRRQFFYVNDKRVKYNLQNYFYFQFLKNEFTKRNLGGLHMRSSLSVREVQTFITLFNAVASAEDPFSLLAGGLNEGESIIVSPLDMSVQKESQDAEKLVKKTYFSAVSQFKDFSKKIDDGEEVAIKNANFIIRAIVDRVIDEEQTLLSMTSIKNYDEYTFYHSVNVSILAVTIGSRLGLNRRELFELGISGFFHDVGKIKVPRQILNKPAKLDDTEWDVMRSHPAKGVGCLLSKKTFSRLAVRSAIVSFEHHMAKDASGYPRVSGNYNQDLYSKIISIADRFDAMTASRIYTKKPRSPEEAVAILSEGVGKNVDAALLRIFIDAVGIFPIGTVVLLDTRELAVVFRVNSVFLDRPQVVLVTDSKGNRVERRVIDLTEKDTGKHYTRSIKSTVDPSKFHINIVEFLFPTVSSKGSGVVES